METTSAGVVEVPLAVAGDACGGAVLAAPLGEHEAADLARGFAALADPVRLRLLSMLAAAPGGEACVCDIVGPLGRSQPTVSHHLRVLGDSGLVHGDRRGKWVWYSLDADRLAELSGAIDNGSPRPGAGAGPGAGPGAP